MKKLFTFLTCVLIAGFAFGQKKWTVVNVNVDCEADAPAYTDYSEMTPETWNSYWCQYGDEGVAGRYTTAIAEGLGVDGSRCVKVESRTKAAGEEAGNQPGGKFETWDSQFFIFAKEPIPVGKELRLKMMVKADKAQDLETQAHCTPGNYNHYMLFGNIGVTTEWKAYESSVVVVSNEHDGSGKGFQAVAFNLAKIEEGNTIYFDNIQLQVKDPKVFDENADWVNFMRKGIYSDDPIKGLDGNGNPWSCTNFSIQIPNEAAPGGKELVKAPIVDAGDGKMAVRVPVQGYKVVTAAKLDEAGNPIPVVDDEGNPVLDGDGNPTYEMTSTYYWNDGKLVGDGTNKPERYACQFFVSTLHKMVANEHYKFRFLAKADRATQLGTQCHYGPSQYKDWNTFGGESDFPIGTDWTEFNLGEAQGKTIPNGAAGCQTITFDCVSLEGEDNNLYFIFEECSFTEETVTVEDRSLGAPEQLALPVSNGEEETATTIDASKMLSTFEVNDFSFLINPGQGDGIKLLSQVESEDEDGVFIDTYSSKLSWTDGGFINEKGYFIEDEGNMNGIQLYFDESSIDGSKVDLNVWNNPDAKIQFGDHKILKTNLAISESGWYYLYNVTLVGQEDYQEWLEHSPGDANSDGAVDIEDVVGIVNKILNEPAAKFNFFSSDVNEDRNIDVDDIVAVVNLILNQAAETE